MPAYGFFWLAQCFKIDIDEVCCMSKLFVLVWNVGKTVRHTAAVKILFFIKDVLKNLFIDKKKTNKKTAECK